ncbi:MAG: hydrogenase maturation nickel metallochaperone HypA [Mailhella sp.]|nr:hydrogenase maturation nickel metallochaperone HypA [Mailhella sp.]
MHELSLMEGIFDIAEREMAVHGAKKLHALHVRCGALANVVPESMRFAFEAMKADRGFPEAELFLTEEALRVRCPECGHEFSPNDRSEVYLPCARCGNPFGFTVLEGEDIFLDKLEAE